MAEIKSTNKYLVRRKYKTINGTTYPMDEYQVVLFEEESEDCGWIRPQYQWSATTGYLCDNETYTKYAREVKMISYDSGTTWSVAQPVEERRGDVIAYDSYDCGKPMYRCIETDETYCEDNGDDFAASFYRNNEVIPRVTIECSNSVIYEQDKDYFSSSDSSITQVNIGDCVTEFRKFYWSFSSATLTIGNNVRLVWDWAIAYGKFLTSLSKPIILPPSVKKIEEHELNGTTCYIKPLANPSVDEFAIRRVDESTYSPVVEGNYNIVAPYGTKYNWEQLKLIEQISGGTVVQEDYQTPNEDWKVKITFEDNSVNYLADDPTHVLGANEIDRMSNILADSSSDRHWYRQNNQVLVGTRKNYYAIKEIEISSTVSAVTENAIKNFYSYICNFKLNDGLLVFGDMFNNQVSPYMGNEYHNYTVTMPSTLTAITSSRICPSKVTFRNVTYGYTLKFTSVIPPVLEHTYALDNAVKILVPCGSLNRYITEWSQYAEKIFGDDDSCLELRWVEEEYKCENEESYRTDRLYKCNGLGQCYKTETTRDIDLGRYCTGYKALITHNISKNPYLYIPCDGNSVLTSTETSQHYSHPKKVEFGVCVESPYYVTSIGDGAFNGWTELNEISLTDNIVSIGNRAFRHCYNLPSMVIPNSVTSIGDSAFENCNGFTSITIGNSVETIGSQAFSNCYRASGITIPNSVTSIGSSAFTTCSGITSIEIPSGVTSIGNYAFYRCGNMKEVVIQSGGIGDNAFLDCVNLKNVEIRSGVTTIGQSAFQSCPNISSCTIDNGVTSIGVQAFWHCDRLQSINIPDSVTSIGSKAFQYCSGLTNATLGSGLTTIVGSIFSNCKSLTSIEIPSGVTSIGNYVFNNCTSLTSCTFAEGSQLANIGDYTFSGCTSLSNITIPNSVTSIGNNAFAHCDRLQSINIPDNVTNIGNGAFRSCSGLTSINIPSGITSISYQAFSYCKGFTSIDIPSGVTSIGDYAFEYCTSLTSIDIPSGVTSIGYCGFYSCGSLTSITVNAVTPPTLGGSALTSTNNCPIYVPAESVSTYKAADGWAAYKSRIQAIL